MTRGEIMTPIFNRSCACVGWYNAEGMVFGANLEWIGFVADKGFFSADLKWLGGLVNGTFVDKIGKPVAWLQGFQPKCTNTLLSATRPIRPVTPIRPIRPLQPLKPLKPLTPLGGWSTLDWNSYLEQ